MVVRAGPDARIETSSSPAAGMAVRLRGAGRIARAKGTQAVRTEGEFTKRVTRHPFTKHLLADGYDTRTMQERLGHTDA